MADLTWTCECGAVEARVPADGMRLVCYCESCRAFVERFGKTDRLNAAGGSELLQVDPQHVTFTRGVEHLRYMKITEKGPLRWYAACCGTPMANTLGARWVSFASFQTHDMAPKERLPEKIAHVNLKGALARVEEPLGSVRSMIAALIGRTVKSVLTGGGRRNPFFGADGRPIAPREVPPQSRG